jgi:protein-tyrosine-phosphatase
MTIKDIKSMLFVCTGNTCRSPMAEYLAKGRAAEEGLEMEIASRGFSASEPFTFDVGPAEDTCEEVLAIYPNSLVFAHSPKRIKVADVVNFDLVLTMEEKQRDDIFRVVGKYMKLNNRVFAIREYAGIWGAEGERLDVRDPMGGGARRYDEHDQSEFGLVSVSGFQGDIGELTGAPAEVVEPEIPDKPLDKMTHAEWFACMARRKRGKSKSHASHTSCKKSDEENLYVVCRKMLVQCLDNIFSDNIPSLDEVLKQRKARDEYYQAHKETTSYAPGPANPAYRETGDGWVVVTSETPGLRTEQETPGKRENPRKKKSPTIPAEAFDGDAVVV